MKTQLKQILTKYNYNPEELLAILREAQQIKGWLSPEIQHYLAEELKLPEAEINGVATFYHLFKTQPQGEKQIRVCLGTACYVRGGKEIWQDWQEALNLKEGEISPDGLLSLHTVRCMGACGLAPVVAVNEELKGNFSPSYIPQLIRKIRQESTTNRLSNPELYSQGGETNVYPDSPSVSTHI